MEGNGVSKDNLTPETVERMTDASEIPPPPGSKPATPPRHGARRRDMTAKPLPGTAETAPTQAPLSDEAVTQAAREEIYRRAPVTEDLHPVFNKLSPEEIMYLIAYMHKVYERGVEHGDDGTAVREAFERGQAAIADGPPMRRTMEFMTSLLDAAVNLLEESDPPNVVRFLKTRDKLLEKFQANTGA